MNTQQKHVLIIDDDEDDCDLFSDALKIVDSQTDCEKAFSATQALDLLNNDNYRPDFIFLDLNMHDLDGKKCLAEIMKINGMNEIPIIIYSTSKRASDIADTRNLGAVHFITKPSSFTELCSAIAFVLHRNWLAIPRVN